MKTYALLGITAILFAFAPMVHAEIVTISFDELNTGEDVMEFYSGGFGSNGSGPGLAFGVTFSSGWIAGPPDVYPESQDAKSAEFSGVEIVNAHAGWSGATSYYYSGGDLTVEFYDQENGIGNLVGTLNLQGEPGFSAAGGEFPLFFSAVFNSSNGNRIDALTNGVYVVPEPASVILLSTGLGAIGLAVWGRK